MEAEGLFLDPETTDLSKHPRVPNAMASRFFHKGVTEQLVLPIDRLLLRALGVSYPSPTPDGFRSDMSMSSTPVSEIKVQCPSSRALTCRTLPPSIHRLAQAAEAAADAPPGRRRPSARRSSHRPCTSQRPATGFNEHATGGKRQRLRRMVPGVRKEGWCQVLQVAESG